MPLEQRIFRIFVACPGDVLAEREALESAIDELNQAAARAMGIRLELLHWQTSTYPAMGADPQQIINTQVADEYDIFVGILWGRFGQPTPRAASGTVEEFEQAYSNFQCNPGTVEIMFYFKDEPIAPSRIDVRQLAGVLKFRGKIEEKGLVATFSSTEEFSNVIRIHLLRVLQGWDRRPGILAPATVAESVKAETIGIAGDDEDEGFLDVIERGTENFELTRAAAERIATYIAELGAASREASGNLEKADFSTPGGVANGKRIFNSLASRMHNFALQLTAELPVMNDAFGKAIASTQAAAQLIPEFPGDPSAHLTANAAMLLSLKDTIQSTRTSIESFRGTVEGLPRMTTQQNRAKKRVRQALVELEVALDEDLRLVVEAHKLLLTLLASASKGDSHQIDRNTPV